MLAGVVCVVLGAGCDWSGTDNDEAWNDSYSWLNFSGTYRLTEAVESGTSAGADNAAEESVGTTTASLYYSGKLANGPVVKGSLTIRTDGAPTFTENGTPDGKLVEIGGTGTGSINYNSGVWSIKFAGSPGAGKSIRANYRYSGTAGTPSGPAITQFTVNQTGNLITMTDNGGRVYSGRVTGASVPEDGSNPGSVNLVFEASNDSAKIVGSFSGSWSGTGTEATSGVLSGRRLNGTYISGKSEVNINAASTDITLTPTETETVTP